jgi:D-glycero-D-manno-heptose 1,7-bisphosphate phosphatase
MSKAVFFDRDGVINSDFDRYYIFRPDDVILNPGIPELLRNLNDRGYLLIVISNQGGISKGVYSQEDVEKTNERIIDLLKPFKVKIEEIYYCTHFHEIEKCICKKPDTLMIEKAICRFKIDPSISYFIGDRETDMEAGRKAGLKTIKVEPNQDMAPLIFKIS